jgi:hypothetical protein
MRYGPTLDGISDTDVRIADVETSRRIVSRDDRNSLWPVPAGSARYEEAAIANRGDLVGLTAVRRLGEIVPVGFDPEAERVTTAPETICESSHQTQQASVSPDGRWLASLRGSGTWRPARSARWRALRRDP